LSIGHDLGCSLALLSPYLESIQLELQVFFLIEQLLQPICQDDVRIIQTAIFFVELKVLLLFWVLNTSFVPAKSLGVISHVLVISKLIPI
jgi:hypothetical protein